ncbi:hypothetical protein MTR67_044228, partial [Solanum verrucosum]
WADFNIDQFVHFHILYLLGHHSPLVDSDHFVHKYFLPQEYAILIFVYAAVALICFLSICIGYVMLESKKKKA